MCGIVGVISKTDKPVANFSLKNMCDSIAHRGPDDSGYVFIEPSYYAGKTQGYYSEYTDSEFHQKNDSIAVYGGDSFVSDLEMTKYHIGMGHRRLSIIDLSTSGHQPAKSSNREIWITFNGEIYNFKELKIQLQTIGHKFYTKSDSEVIIHMWQEYGTDSLKMFNVSFAIAVYDVHMNKLTLARDRFGSRPLYYYENDDFLVYGSEIKAIIASGIFHPEIDLAALNEYFTFQNIFSNKTLIKGINLLGQGEKLSITPSAGEDAKIESFFYGFPRIDNSLKESKETLEELVFLFKAAVKRQMISDVEVGAYLSGGMDSGSIVSVAKDNVDRLYTFTCGFDLTNISGIEAGFDERNIAEQLSYQLQTEHYEIVLHSGDMPAIMEKLSWHNDDLRVGMCHQNWYASKLASRFVKVCLGGAGGDELFAGYPWRYLCGLHGGQEEVQNNTFNYWHRLLPSEELGSLLCDELKAYGDNTRNIFDEKFNRLPYDNEISPLENALQRMLYFEFNTFLNGILLIEDKISLAHGLEVRSPFLDNDLADFAFRIPPSLKLNLKKLISVDSSGREIKANEGKLILRKAMSALLPKFYTNQPKQGFSTPDANWYRSESMPYIKEILFDTKTISRPWFNHRKIQSCLEKHFHGTRNYRLLIWSLLSFELLQRHFLDNN